MKNLFKKKNKKQEGPRALDVIKKEYSELCNRAGQLQYTMAVNEQELNSINSRLFNINNEAAERNRLNAAEVKPKESLTPLETSQQ